MEKDLGPGSSSQLCVSLRISAVSALRTVLTQRPQRYAEIRRVELNLLRGGNRDWSFSRLPGSGFELEVSRVRNARGS